MTQAEREQYFKYHNSNMKLLKIGFTEIREQVKKTYKTQTKTGDYIYLLPNQDTQKIKLRKIEKSYYRILTGIQVSWAEESIKRLFYEKNLLTNIQRDYLLARPALDQRWYKTLKIIFCIAYDLVPTGDETCQAVNIQQERNNLGQELVDRYFNLKSIIRHQLVPNFTLRNKVQHGEWEFAFSSNYSKEFRQDLTDKVNNENIVTTTSRYTIVNALYQMIVELGRFKSDNFAIDSMITPFEYFYEGYIKKIQSEVNKIANPDLELFISDIVHKELRGAQYRAS